MPEVNEKAIEKAVATHVQRAQAFTITTSEQYAAAVDFLKDLRSLKKQIDESFDPIIDAQRMALQAARDSKNKHYGPVDQADKMLTQKVGSYRMEQERKRREEEERINAQRRREAEQKAREEAERKAAELREAGLKREANKVIKEAAKAPVEAPPPVSIQSSTPKIEGISSRKNWTFRIVDDAKVPREYLVPDEKKIRGVVKAMKEKANIPGVEVYAEESVTVKL